MIYDNQKSINLASAFKLLLIQRGAKRNEKEKESPMLLLEKKPEGR